ncbi:MAG: NlpC/P60 family protein [Patescibacteria group bacterium]
MEKYYICNLAVIPMRKEPNHTSEMVSQIRFGEIFEAYDIPMPFGWMYVKTIHDQYDGWVHCENIRPISASIFNKLKNRKSVKFSDHGAFLETEDIPGRVYLPFGVRVNLNSSNLLSINGVVYKYWGPTLKKTNKLDDVLFFARKLLNTPYLWGGRSQFGVDCSGFTQVAYQYAAGICLPRDAWQQATFGQLVEYDDIRKGDLLFFKSSGDTIVHVGIAMGDKKIIHASGTAGCVVISKFDRVGIKLTKSAHSHTFAFAKRLL